MACHGSKASLGLSLREGVLAKASAVRPRATPPCNEKDTHRHNGHLADNTHSLRVLRNRTLSLMHSYICTFVHLYIRTFIRS